MEFSTADSQARTPDRSCERAEPGISTVAPAGLQYASLDLALTNSSCVGGSEYQDVFLMEGTSLNAGSRDTSSLQFKHEQQYAESSSGPLAMSIVETLLFSNVSSAFSVGILDKASAA